MGQVHRGSDKPIIDFGDSFVLNQLIWGIGYNAVLESINYANMDSLYAMVHYYTLDADANCHALNWFTGNFASHLYPKANLASQRISELLKFLGRPEVRRRFLLEHMQFVLGTLKDKIMILLDSAGIENDCNIDLTHLVSKNGESTKQFKVVAIVLRGSGLPLYYEPIDGNILDKSTYERLINILAQYKYQVGFSITDAGYNCPKNIERLLIMGVGIMMRMSPNIKGYKDVVKEHIDELESPKNLIKFNERFVYV